MTAIRSVCHFVVRALARLRQYVTTSAQATVAFLYLKVRDLLSKPGNGSWHRSTTRYVGDTLSLIEHGYILGEDAEKLVKLAVEAHVP